MAGFKAIKEVLGNFRGKVFYDEPISRHTSFCVGGPADALVIIEDEDQLAQVVGVLSRGGKKYLPVGNLTNIIVRDGGYRGVILLMKGLRKYAANKRRMAAIISEQRPVPLYQNWWGQHCKTN
jgi:UDP-N-acetylmuramate dehydrogenase